jgi:hypothetical protein
MRKRLLFAWALLFCCACARFAHGAAIPHEITKVVTFIFLSPDGGKSFTPNGTGFFVGVKSGADRFRVYLVTAKHVLKDSTGQYRQSVWIRLNKKGGGSGMITLPLTGKGAAPVYEHPTDHSVDLAVIPCLPSQDLFDFQFIPDEMLTTKDAFAELNISEGSDVFFCGLFAQFVGQSQNYPITRFGKVAMMPSEKIPWQDAEGRPPEMVDLYLLETQSFGGNSGSPVFFYLGQDRQPGSIIVGPPVIKLAGVMKGTFRDASPLVMANQNVIPLSLQNVGIAAVVPSYHLHEILFSDPLRSLK